jgi:phage tail-like protein
MATGSRREAFGAYYFTLQVDGIVDAYFRSCSGLKSEAEVQELAEGGLNTTTHKLVGRTKYPNIVLKQGFSGHELFKLRELWLNDSPGAPLGVGGKRIGGIITQLGPRGAERKWKFEEGWICKWEGPDFDASKNEVSVESIEIAHEGLITL